MFQERGEGDAGDAAYVMTDFSSGRMVTMSSASRSLAMPSLLSEMSKAWPRGQGVGGVGGVQKAWLGQGVGVRV